MACNTTNFFGARLYIITSGLLPVFDPTTPPQHGWCCLNQPLRIRFACTRSRARIPLHRVSLTAAQSWIRVVGLQVSSCSCKQCCKFPHQGLLQLCVDLYHQGSFLTLRARSSQHKQRVSQAGHRKPILRDEFCCTLDFYVETPTHNPVNPLRWLVKSPFINHTSSNLDTSI